MKLLVAISFWKIPVSSKTPSQGHRPAGVDLKGLSNFQKTGVFCQALCMNTAIKLTPFAQITLSSSNGKLDVSGSGFLVGVRVGL